MNNVTIEFSNREAAENFISWLCDQGEQDYWENMSSREFYQSGPITALDFNFYGDDKEWNTIPTTCGRLDDD